MLDNSPHRQPIQIEHYAAHLLERLPLEKNAHHRVRRRSAAGIALNDSAFDG